MALEEIAGNVFDWKGFERFGAASTDPVTSGAFAAKTTTAGVTVFQSGAAYASDPYGTGFGLRFLYSTGGAALNVRRPIIVPANWKKLFFRFFFNTATNTLSSGKKFEVFTLLNAAGNDVLGVCYERAASGLHLRPFFGAPSDSGHPSGSYLGGTNTTATSTATQYELLLVAEAVGLTQTNLTLYRNGSALETTINDSAMTNGPHSPYATVPGGAMTAMFGSKSMSSVEVNHDFRVDVARIGVTPPELAQSAGLGFGGCAGSGFFVGEF